MAHISTFVTSTHASFNNHKELCSNTFVLSQDEGDKLIVCERGDLVFVFNFNPSQSFSDYGVGCKNAGSYKVCYLGALSRCMHTLNPRSHHSMAF